MGEWLGAIVRFIVSAFVLLGVSILLPGIEIVGFTNALIASIIIALAGYLLESIFGKDISPQQRGLIGFVISAVVIFGTQYLVEGMEITMIGALLAALVIGVIDYFVPTELR